jgi:hypothetical protein
MKEVPCNPKPKAKDGRGGGIRTRDPLRPRQVRYQTALRPDCSLCALHNDFMRKAQLLFFGFENSMKNLVILVNTQSFYGASGQFYHTLNRFLDADCVQ